MASHSSSNYGMDELTYDRSCEDYVAADNLLYEQQLSSCFKVSVEGHDTSLDESDVTAVYATYFSSCGNIFDVVIPTELRSGRVKRRGSIYFMDEASQRNAQELDGSNVGFPFIGRYNEYSHVASTLGGWKVVVKALPRPSCEFSPYELAETRRRTYSSDPTRGLFVSGYDTSLPLGVIRNALLSLFRPCGEIVYLDIRCNPDQPGHLNSSGLLCVNGDEASDKAMQLNGTDMGGWNVVVESDEPTLPSHPIPPEYAIYDNLPSY